MFIHILSALPAVRAARGQKAFECDLMFHSVSVSLCVGPLSSQGPAPLYIQQLLWDTQHLWAAAPQDAPTPPSTSNPSPPLPPPTSPLA